MIAKSENGSQVQVPASLTEYFALDPLPCPVVGCTWRGAKMGLHARIKHGIGGDELRRLLGANKTQALSSMSFCERRSELTRNQPNNRLASGECRADLRTVPRRGGEVRRQTEEIQARAREPLEVRKKLRAAAKDSINRERSSEAAKAQWAEMEYVEKQCIECGETYSVARVSIDRSKFCGTRCKQRHARKLRSQRQ